MNIDKVNSSGAAHAPARRPQVTRDPARELLLILFLPVVLNFSFYRQLILAKTKKNIQQFTPVNQSASQFF